MGICKNTRNGMGLGWCNLVVQFGNLYPSWYTQNRNPLYSEWKGMEQYFGKQGRFFYLFSLYHLVTLIRTGLGATLRLFTCSNVGNSISACRDKAATSTFSELLLTGASCTCIFFLCYLIVFIFSHYRLPSLQRKTMVENRGKHNGHQHKDQFMVFSLLAPTLSMKIVAIRSFQKLQI